jgi:aldose 1-epimerase
VILSLRHGEIALDVLPSLGGGITRFHWRGIPIFRDAVALDSPLGLSSFVLLPFSNRIAGGRFVHAGREVQLPPNFPAASTLHPIHGFGWTAPWQVTARDSASMTMAYSHPLGDWPWSFHAEQSLSLHHQGFHHSLRLTNLSDRPMPAGLGLHPYFPKRGAQLRTRFTGHWRVSDDGLPLEWLDAPGGLDLASDPPVDTLFTGRDGDLVIDWTQQGSPGHRLTITPAAELPHTHIYTPAEADYFCIEPVSHRTNAINAANTDDRPRDLGPGASWQVSADYRVTIL